MATEGSLFSVVDSALTGQATESQPKKRASVKWVPTEWRIEYERVVAMDVIGLSGVDIATRTGYTPQHVYNILGTPQALEIQKLLIEQLRKNSTVDIGKTLTEIEEMTVKRLKQALKDDDIFLKAPATWVGKGLEVMKGKGEHLKNAPTGVVNNYNTAVMPESVWSKFIAGMEKADLAKQLSSGEIEDAVVVSDNNDS